MSKFIQQGDVLIFGVESIPEGLNPSKRIKEGRFVLAEGEATGHAHTVPMADCSVMESPSGELWMDVKSAAVVSHQEHGPVRVAPGKYRIGIVREVDPFAEEIRRVTD